MLKDVLSIVTLCIKSITIEQTGWEHMKFGRRKVGKLNEEGQGKVTWPTF